MSFPPLSAPAAAMSITGISNADHSLSWHRPTANMIWHRDLMRDHAGILYLDAEPTAEAAKYGLRKARACVVLSTQENYANDETPHFIWKDKSGNLQHHLFFHAKPFGFTGQQVFLHSTFLRDEGKATLLSFGEGYDLARAIAEQPTQPLAAVFKPGEARKFVF